MQIVTSKETIIHSTLPSVGMEGTLCDFNQVHTSCEVYVEESQGPLRIKGNQMTGAEYVHIESGSYSCLPPNVGD